MGTTIIYQNGRNFNYYLIDLFTGEPEKVSEGEFFSIVGTDRNLVPMKYAPGNINRQNFYLSGDLIGYRERTLQEGENYEIFNL